MLRNFNTHFFIYSKQEGPPGIKAYDLIFAFNKTKTVPEIYLKLFFQRSNETIDFISVFILNLLKPLVCGYKYKHQ